MLSNSKKYCTYSAVLLRVPWNGLPYTYLKVVWYFLFYVLYVHVYDTVYLRKKFEPFASCGTYVAPIEFKGEVYLHGGHSLSDNNIYIQPKYNATN